MATWLLERVVPESNRDAVLGDLAEEYALRARSADSLTVSRWYWGQVYRSIPRMVWGSVRSGRWLSTLGVAIGAYIAAGALEFAGTAAISRLLAPDASVYTLLNVVVGLTTMGIGGYFATWIRPGAATALAGIVIGSMEHHRGVPSDCWKVEDHPQPLVVHQAGTETTGFLGRGKSVLVFHYSNIGNQAA